MSKQILIDAFEKAEREIGSNKKTHLARHLSDTLLEEYKYTIHERTLRDYYNKIKNDSFGTQDDLKPKLIECLCQYLGYRNYAEYVSDNPEIEPIKRSKKKKGIEIKKRNKTGKLGLTIIVVFAIGSVLFFTLGLWNKDTSPALEVGECMTWADSLYVKHSCDEGPYSKWGSEIIPFSEHLFKNMKRVKVDAGYTFFNEKKEPLVWYCKINDDEVEFYKSPGLHPTNGKTLKAVTEYIIEKYVPIHQLKEDSFLE